MEFIVSNKIKVINPSAAVKRYCENNLELDNPDFIKKKRMGKWLGNTPRKIQLYERNGNDLILPFGCFADLWNIYPVKTAFRNHIKPFERVSYDSKISLYQYQETAVKTALAKRNGVIVMPCGSGKTQTALELASRLGGKTLWLTHTQDLLRQSMNRAMSVFGLSKDKYGTITEGKVNVGEVLTFATVQTMSNIDVRSFGNTFNVVIVDECHKAVGSPTKMMQFYKVLSNLSARYKYGLTATPYRSDNLERCMFALLGNIIVEVSKKEVAHTTCDVEVHKTETGFYPDMSVVLSGDGTLNYSSLIDNLTHDEERFKFVLKTIEQLPANSPALVLANRVDYLNRLNKEYFGTSACLSSMGSSKSAKEERKNALRALNKGDIDCLFATYQLAKEGLDVPNLRYVIFATPEKNKTTVIQAAGRVGRKAEGKEKGIIIDFVDNFGMYQGWWKKRKRIYRSSGYEVMNDD